MATKQTNKQQKNESSMCSHLAITTPFYFIVLLSNFNGISRELHGSTVLLQLIKGTELHKHSN